MGKKIADIRAGQTGLDPARFQVQIDPSGTCGLIFFPFRTLHRINEDTCNNAGKLPRSGDGIDAACLNNC